MGNKSSKSGVTIIKRCPSGSKARTTMSTTPKTAEEKTGKVTIIPTPRENYASESRTARDHRIVYSEVQNNTDSEPKRVKTNWIKFVDIFRNPILRGIMSLKDYLACKKDDTRNQLANEQKNGKGIIPGEFSREGTKSKDGLKSRTLLVLDLDDGYYSFERLVKKLRKFSCIIHTSYSHSKKDGKFRVYIQLDKPVTEDIEITCALMLDYFETLLGSHIDIKCWTVSQLYYTPSCPHDAEELYRFKHIMGKPIRTSNFRLSKAANSEVVKEAIKPTGLRPGDDYNLRGGWNEHLQKLGWRSYSTDRKGNECWTRPGKSGGVSGVVFKDSNVFYVFSSDQQVAPFEGGKAYSLFTAYTMIIHDGNFSTAACQLRSEGYGGSEGEKEKEAAKKQGLVSFPLVPFPLEVLPAYFRETIDKFSKSLQCPPEFMAMNFLTVASGAAGNTVKLAIKESWQTAPFIWLGIIDVTGSGKSHPIDAAMKPLHRLQAVDAVRFDSEMLKYRQQLSLKLKDKKNSKLPIEPTKLRDYYSNNFTIESLISMFKTSSRGIVIHADELAGLLKSLGQYKNGKGADNELFLSLFNCGPLKVNRKSGSEYCRESGAAVIGGIQPEVFSQVFKDKEHESGMVYRFLPMLLDAPPPMFSDYDLSKGDEGVWSNLIDWMYAIPAPVDPVTGVIIKNTLIVEDDGKKIWIEFHDNLSEQQKYMPNRFKGYIPKLITYSLKFMAVLHLLKCYQKGKLSLTVKESTVRGAIALTRYFAGQAMLLAAGLSKEQELFVSGASEDQEAIYTETFNQALISLKDEVKNGKLYLIRIRERVNELLPPTLAPISYQDKRLGAWLRKRNLQLKQSTGRRTAVIWDDGICLG
ncbi:MAG: hypothetical protein A2075_23855 [Geobacteraceae bacterium GWC2_58_44]|nr:MAG: hypothetical protein A2075_23855 [Geobacteraceae bacterium GWC2_58_44]